MVRGRGLSVGLARCGLQEEGTGWDLLATGNKAAAGKGVLLEALFSWGHSESETSLVRAGVQLLPVCSDAPEARLETCDACPVSPWRRLGRALTAASSAEAWGADPRETRAGPSPGGWASARPRIAARGPRPADFLKGQRTQKHPQNRWKMQIPGPCSPRCCCIRPGVQPRDLYF